MFSFVLTSHPEDIANAVPLLELLLRLSQFRREQQTGGDLYPIAPPENG